MVTIYRIARSPSKLLFRLDCDLYQRGTDSHRPSPFVRSDEGAKTQRRVWDELNTKLEKIHPGILGNI